MKTNLLFLLLIVLFTFSCSNEDQFEVEENVKTSSNTPPSVNYLKLTYNTNTTMTINEIRSFYSRNYYWGTIELENLLTVDPNIANFEINTLGGNMCSFMFSINGDDYFSLVPGIPGDGSEENDDNGGK